VTDAEQKGDGWDEYTGRDREVVAMVFSGENLWRNLGLEHGGFEPPRNGWSAAT
jgi:hypothetical protein